MADDAVRIQLLTRLQHSLQALALPAEVQLSLFPNFVCKVDELALDFWHWSDCVLTNYPAELTEQQYALLQAMNGRLAAISGQDNAPLWTEQALHVAPEWDVIRQFARETLAAFDWDVATPPSYGHEYMPDSGVETASHNKA